MPHRLWMLFPALLLPALHSFAEGMAPAATAARASGAAAALPGPAADARQSSPRPPGSHTPHPGAARVAATAPGTGRAAAPAAAPGARSPGADAAAARSGAGAPAPLPAASASERAQREAEHPYFWIRRNGELAYQRYAARLAQARAEGLPPPPTRAATGRPALPATAFDPEKLPPTSAGPAAVGSVISTQPGAGPR